MRKKTELIELVKKIEGMHTVETLAETLNVSKRTAMNIASKLRKSGFLCYYSGGRKKRIYQISPFRFRLLGRPGLYETINKYSRTKLQEPFKHVIHDRRLSIEEALILAIKSGNIRLILFSLSLFAHIKNWSLLNKLAKKNNLQRNIGALYDITKLIIRVRKMDERTRKSLIKGNGKEYIIESFEMSRFASYVDKLKANLEHVQELKVLDKTQNSLRSPLKTLFINGKLEGYSKSSIKGISSNNYKDIEKKWRVKIPFNLKDLQRLKTG